MAEMIDVKQVVDVSMCSLGIIHLSWCGVVEGGRDSVCVGQGGWDT